MKCTVKKGLLALTFVMAASHAMVFCQPNNSAIESTAAATATEQSSKSLYARLNELPFIQEKVTYLREHLPTMADTCIKKYTNVTIPLVGGALLTMVAADYLDADTSDDASPASAPSDRELLKYIYERIVGVAGFYVICMRFAAVYG